MIPSSGMTNPDETRRNLHAAHCASSDRGLDVGPEELEGVVTWKRGAPVTVVCPGTEVVHRETLGGYVVRCDAERVDLYVKLGRVTPEEMVGCLAILGARDAVAADLEATQIPDGFQAAFQLRNRTYVWTEKKTDGPDDAIDNVEMLPETYPETAAARQE